MKTKRQCILSTKAKLINLCTTRSWNQKFTEKWKKNGINYHARLTTNIQNLWSDPEMGHVSKNFENGEKQLIQEKCKNVFDHIIEKLWLFFVGKKWRCPQTSSSNHIFYTFRLSGTNHEVSSKQTTKTAGGQKLAKRLNEKHEFQ